MAGDGRKTRQKAGSDNADVKVRRRKTAGNVAAAKAKPADPGTSAKKEAVPLAAEETLPAANNKVDNQQVGDEETVSHASPVKPTVSAPAPSASREPPQHKRRRHIHPVALWSPLLLIGVLVWFMRGEEPAPSPEETAVVATEIPAGANELVVAPAVGEGVQPKADLKDKAPEVQPQEPAGVMSRSRSETPSPLATSPGKPAVGDGKNQIASALPSGRRGVTVRPATQSPSMSSPAHDLRAKRTKATSSTREKIFSVPEIALAPDPKTSSAAPASPDGTSGQALAGSRGLPVTKPEPRQPIAPASTVRTEEPRVPMWPPPLPPNISFYGPYAYPPAVGRPYFRSYGPMNVSPYRHPAYSNWLPR